MRPPEVPGAASAGAAGRGGTLADLPDQAERTALVTGANGGLGSAITRALVDKGASVLMACRNVQRGAATRQAILAQKPDARLQVEPLDLASLASVRALAERLQARHAHLDLLFLNAGVMALGGRRTEEGYELHFGVNHLAHFVLTGLLWPLLAAAPAARVVSTTSNGAYFGRLPSDDVLARDQERRWRAYLDTKLCNLLFSNALNRRLEQGGGAARAHAAHPGLVPTNLQRRADAEAHLPGERLFLNHLIPWLGQDADAGALPIVVAGLHAAPRGGDLWGPRWFHVRGAPRRLRQPRRARDVRLQERLWACSERLGAVALRL